MKREDIEFDSRDNKSKIHAIKWIPEGEVKGILQIIHGMAEHIERYEAVAEYFTQRGILVTGDDHLGHGKTVRKEDTYGYFCEQDPATVVVRDVHRLKKMTQEAYPGVPYIIMGHSMGSFIMRNYMFRYGKGIQGAIVCGTAYQPAVTVKTGLALTTIQSLFLGSKHPARMINDIAFGNQSKMDPAHKNDWLCTDHRVVEQYDADPLCGFLFTLNGFKTMFTLLDRLNDMNNLKKIPVDLPVFVISGSEDIVGNCSVGVRKVFEQYKALGIKDVEIKLYEGLRHEILNEPVKEEVYSDIYSWIQKRIEDY